MSRESRSWLNPREGQFLVGLIRDNQTARSLAESPLRRGLGITVPYKAAVIPLLDAVDGDVEAIGAANYLTI